MAKVHFTGLQDMDFTSRDGKQIDGIKLFFTYPDENVMGIKADSKFVNRDSCKNLGFTVDSLSPLIGKDVEIETNIKGGITGVRAVAKSN